MHETLYFAICTGLGVRQLGGRRFGDFVLLSRYIGVAIGARHIHNTAHVLEVFQVYKIWKLLRGARSRSVVLSMTRKLVRGRNGEKLRWRRVEHTKCAGRSRELSDSRCEHT